LIFFYIFSFRSISCCLVLHIVLSSNTLTNFPILWFHDCRDHSPVSEIKIWSSC
jgi:hypothetical protein